MSLAFEGMEALENGRDRGRDRGSAAAVSGGSSGTDPRRELGGAESIGPLERMEMCQDQWRREVVRRAVDVVIGLRSDSTEA